MRNACNVLKWQQLLAFEEMVWKRELKTEKDEQIFYGAARI